MSDYGPGPESGAGTGEILAAEEAGASFELSSMADQIDEIAASSSLDEAMLRIDLMRGEIGSLAPSPENAARLEVLVSLSDAYHTGLITPEETPAALEWIRTVQKVPRWSVTALVAGGLVSLLALWSVDHHDARHPVPARRPGPATSRTRTATRAPVGPPAATRRHRLATIAVGTGGVAPKTAGAKLVDAASGSIPVTDVSAPGLTETEARAVTLALEVAADDQARVLAGVVDDLLARITALEGVATGGLSAAHGAAATSAAVTHDLEHLHELSTRRIGDLEGALQVALKRAESAEKAATHAVKLATEKAPSGSDRQLRTLAGKVGLIEQTLPSLAPIAMVAPIAAGLKAVESAPPASEPVLAASNISGLPPELTRLEDCCAENAAITGPIRNSGATPSLLSQLGSLLTKAYALLILAGVIDAVLLLVDTPAVVLATMQGAEWVMPIAIAAAEAATSDLSAYDVIATSS